MSWAWQDVERVLVEAATDDLRSTSEVQPALAAFAGDDWQFLAWLRPFARGRYHDPMTEVLGLALALGCDRLALSISGRAWSMDDPVPPVTADGDLRQRVLVLHCVDAAGEKSVWSVLRPFSVAGGEVRWQARQALTEGPLGWIPQALETTATATPPEAPLADVRRQAERIAALGHDLIVPTEVRRRLRLAAVRPTGQVP